MVKATKPRICRFCGKALSEDNSKSSKQCFECSVKRMRRWYELLQEAKAKFDEEYR